MATATPKAAKAPAASTATEAPPPASPPAPATPEPRPAPATAATPPPPPPPSVPKRPARVARPPASQVAAPQNPAPAPTTRELPTDPVERERALATVKDEADLCVGLLDVIFGNIWTKERLTDAERETIHGPMSGVIYKHGGTIPIEWQLALAVGFAAAPRYAKHKAATKKTPGQAATIPAPAPVN